MGAVQNAAKRKIAMDFNGKMKLDTKQVRDVRQGTLANLLVRGSRSHSNSNGFAPYRSSRKKFKRNDQE